MAIFGRSKNRDDELGDEVHDVNDYNDAPEPDGFAPPDEFDESVGISHLDASPGKSDDEEEADAKRIKKKNKGRKAKGRQQDEDDEVEEEPEKVDWGSPIKPSLSLPSRAIIEAVDRGAAQQKMKKFFIISAAGLLAFGITAGGLNIYSAGLLEGAKSEGRALDNAVSQLQPIADYSTAYESRRDAVTKVLSKGIDYTSIQNSIFKVADQNGVLIKSEANSQSGCMAPSPFVAPTGLGCITLQVDAADSASISRFASGITAEKGIPDAYITGITTSEGGKAGATLSFNYDNKLVSPRYLAFAGSTAKTTGGAPATAPSTGAPTTEGGK